MKKDKVGNRREYGGIEFGLYTVVREGFSSNKGLLWHRPQGSRMSPLETGRECQAEGRAWARALRSRRAWLE